MKLLKNTKDVDRLNKALDACRGEVLLRSNDGSEEYSLKSSMSRLIGIGELCKDSADRFEIYCMERGDERHLMNFFYDMAYAA